VKVVADTNVLVSGLLWGGPPNRILRWARDGVLAMLACEETLGELKTVMRYDRLSSRLSALETTPEEMVAYAMNLMRFVPTPKKIPKTIAKDPFDNIFLAIADQHRAGLIISGDHHILDLQIYIKIPIVTPSEAAAVVRRLGRSANSR